MVYWWNPTIRLGKHKPQTHWWNPTIILRKHKRARVDRFIKVRMFEQMLCVEIMSSLPKSFMVMDILSGQELSPPVGQEK